MKARLTVCLSGVGFTKEVGETVEGEEAVRLCAKGFAVPIREERETAEASPKLEKATVRQSPKPRA